MQRFKAALTTGNWRDNPEPLVRSWRGDFVLYADAHSRIAELESQLAEREANRRADCINFHFWWMHQARGTNTLEGYEDWSGEVEYCKCSGPITRTGYCESCEKLSPPIRYTLPSPPEEAE